jgi:hypothetical protein
VHGAFGRHDCAYRDVAARGGLKCKTRAGPCDRQQTNGEAAMDKVPVWIRPLANVCLVRVEGVNKVDWLLKLLSQSFVFKTSDPVIEDEGSLCSTFRLAYSSGTPRRQLERLLASIPEIRLIRDLA